MATRTLYTQIDTQKTIAEVKQATVSAFRNVGGQVSDTKDSLSISQGKKEVRFGFAADVQASIDIHQVHENRIEIECRVKWTLSALSWICLVVGFFVLGILWIVPLLYLFVDPTDAYQRSLDRIPSYLD